MPWSLGIVVLKNSFLFILGGQEGVFAYGRKRISFQLAEYLQEILSCWGLDKNQIENVYLAVALGFERLLPSEWNHVHLRQTTYPVEKNPLLPEVLGKRIHCFNGVGEYVTWPDQIIKQGANADTVSVIASFSPLFPDREERLKKEVLDLNPGVRVFCSYTFPILNFFLRDKCLIFQALSANILEKWHQDIVDFFGNGRIRIWLVEDEALYWGSRDERPQKAGLESDRVFYFLMARGVAIKENKRDAVAVFRKNDRFHVLEVTGKDVRLLGEENIFNTGRSLAQVKSLLRNSTAGQKLTPLFNFTGMELGLGYPFQERKAAFSPATLGLGLFNSPIRLKVYTLSLQQNQHAVKEELAAKLIGLNREKQLFVDPKISFEEMPLRYLPYSGFFITAVLSPSSDSTATPVPTGQANSTVLPTYPR